MNLKSIKIFTDGAAKGNPGPAGIGVIILNDKDEVLTEEFKYLGSATNNVAEYEALVTGLKLAQKYIPCVVNAYLDSELVVNQMIGNFRVKNEVLAKYFKTAQELALNFEKVNFSYIPREQNKLADKLANKAINLYRSL